MNKEDSEDQRDRLESLIASYLEAERNGDPVDREALISNHPDLADALRAAFVEHDKTPNAAAMDTPTLPPTSNDPQLEQPTLPSDVLPNDDSTLAPSSSEFEAPKIGERVRYFGDYELLEEIARGGMGVVYKAKQVSLNRIVALKMILSGQIAGEDEIRRFHLEAEAAANLDHPGIVPIYDIGEHNGQHYFSMKFVEGKTLGGLSKELRHDHARAVELVARVADAIHHAHQRGILHRDLKPGNVLLDGDGQPMVTDFGLARRTDGDQQLTQTGAVVGTPGFMSPEQASGKGVTTATDIYSLGAILYDLLCGQPPHVKESVIDTLMAVISDPPTQPRRLNSSIAADLELICLKALAKEPSDRYASAGEFAKDLRAHLAGEPVAVRPPSIVELIRLWVGKNYGNVVWVPIIAVIVGLISGISVWLGSVGTDFVNSDELYSNFPATDRPWWSGSWLRVLSLLTAPGFFIAGTSIGLATVLLVKTKNRAADVGAGLGVGLLAGLLAFTFGMGAAMIDTHMDRDDLQMLFRLATNQGGNEAESALLERYPALENHSRYNQAALLTNKIFRDRSASVTSGILGGTVFALMIFGLLGCLQTCVAGSLFRSQRVLAALARYECFTLPTVAITLIGGGIVWFYFTIGATGIIDWTIPVLCLLFSLLAMISVVVRWHWVAQIGLTSAWMILFALFATRGAHHYPVAIERGKIAYAKELLESDPNRRSYQVKLARSHFGCGEAFRNLGRHELASSHYDKAIVALLNNQTADKLESENLALYSAILYWSSLSALDGGNPELASQRMIEHIRLFPNSSRFAMQLYAKSVLALSSPPQEWIFLGNPGDVNDWRKVAAQLHALSNQRAQHGGNGSPWLKSLIDDVMNRASESDDDSDWRDRKDELAAWLASTQRWEIFGPMKLDPKLTAIAALNQSFQLETKLLEPSSELSPEFVLDCSAGAELHLAQELAGKVDLITNVVAYSRSEFDLAEAQTVTFRVGADDLHRIWIDGKQVHENTGSVGIFEGRQQFDVELEKGKHTILIKLTQGQGEWGFVLDAQDADGWPIPLWSAMSDDCSIHR